MCNVHRVCIYCSAAHLTDQFVPGSVTTFVLNHHRCPVRSIVKVPPGHECIDDWKQRATLIRQLIKVPIPSFLVRRSFDYAQLYKLLEAASEDVLGHGESSLKVRKAPTLQKQLPDDKQSPALADRLKCTRD